MRIRTRIFLSAGCLLVATGLVACSKGGPSSRGPSETGTGTRAETVASRRYTRFARLLAGVDDPEAASGDPQRASDAFQSHAREMAVLWTTHNTTAAEIRPWVERELAPVQQAQTLFYPFAGADFLFANAFFPRVHTFVLVGLERVGTLGDLDAMPAKNVELEYARIQKTVTPLLQATFFRTLEMQSDVLQDGVLTVLATLIAGTHHQLVAVGPVALSRDGRVTAATPGGADRTSTPGARIDFVDEGSTDVRTLYYFRTDLSDQGFAKHAGLLAFVDTLPDRVTFTKAAAYTMHGQTFSVIRNYVLNRTQAVLQDDTGVPLRYFDKAHWDVRFFGQYLEPIPMFRNYRQPALTAAFASGKNVGPLPFHIGYGSTAESNLMLAVRKGPTSAAK